MWKSRHGPMTGCQAMPQARHNPGQGGLVSLESPVRTVSPVSLASLAH